MAVDVVGSNIFVLLAVVVALVVSVLVALLGVGGGITSIGDMSLLASSLLSDWRSVLGAEAVDLFIHLSLGNVVLSVMVVVLVSMLTKGRVVGTWVAAVSGVWLGLPLPLSQWWKILLGEAVDFLVHASLSDITVVLLVMLLGLRWWRAPPSWALASLPFGTCGSPLLLSSATGELLWAVKPCTSASIARSATSCLEW